MIWLLLLIPTIISILALFFFQHKLVWWEITLPTIVCVIVIAIMNGVMIGNASDDVEYLSEFPLEARYYEEWDEYIDQTCTEECCCDEDGNCSTTTYDCSYVDYHREYWSVRMNTGRNRNITKSYYDYLVKLWGGETTYKDMNRDYHRTDGDMYFIKWDRNFNHIEPKTFSQTYTNKPQTASTVFKFKELDSLERRGLFNYPKILNDEQVNCIGCTKSDDGYLQKYNAYVGMNKEIKIYIIVFDNKSIEISERQKIYWKGGNKNELVICMDRNSEWVNTFSWMDDKTLMVETNELFRDKTLTLRDKIVKLDDLVSAKWNRKHFIDFEYIKISLTTSQVMWIMGIVLFLSIGLIIFGIFNEFEQTPGGNYRNKFGYYR
jgi:hypothetical protein